MAAQCPGANHMAATTKLAKVTPESTQVRWQHKKFSVFRVFVHSAFVCTHLLRFRSCYQNTTRFAMAHSAVKGKLISVIGDEVSKDGSGLQGHHFIVSFFRTGYLRRFPAGRCRWNQQKPPPQFHGGRQEYVWCFARVTWLRRALVNLIVVITYAYAHTHTVLLVLTQTRR